MTYAHARTMDLSRQRGFSIVELLVAMTLSLIVLAGVLAVMFSSKVTYNENERVGRIQENGRAAIELILRDLRGAGFPGCAQPIPGLLQVNNMLANPTAAAWNLTQPLVGFEGSGGIWTPTLDAALFPNATANNDVVLVRTIPAGMPSMRVSASVSPTAAIAVGKETDETLVVGTPAVISDCEFASIFIVGGFADGGATATISRSTAGGPPSNATTNLGATFAIGAQVAPITSIGYFIAPNPAGTSNSLWRVVGNAAPQEIVPGAQALQIRYGIDTDGDAEVTVNNYVDANAVTDWDQVVSVSLALLIRSSEPNSSMLDTRQYRLLGINLGPFNDRYQRSLFTTTVTLRNRTT